MTQEPKPALACPNCRSTNVRSSLRNGHMMQHCCRGCFHAWEVSLLNEFPSERDLQLMAERLQKRSR
jgi:hypothetical protein